MRSTAVLWRVPAKSPVTPVSKSPKRAAGPLTVHALAHTHWDREWYHPLSRFRAKLVALVDSLLAYPQSPFLLDGQTIVLADYLTIRPERTDEIVRALGTGAIEAGPWFVLADNLIPSGEAIVRNLEAGRRWSQRFSAPTPRVAYCPDTFGHPSALPMIAQEFGFDVAVLWRGFGGSSFPASDTVWWIAPDGRRLLLVHLPPDGYEFGSALPLDAPQSRARWQRIRETLSARNVTGVALLPVGADHHAAPPDLERALKQLNESARPDSARVVRSGLQTAADALLSAAQSHTPVLPTVQGELRDSYGYTWALQGTFGVRAHQKRDNARLERALLRDVEPWAALAWIHGARSTHNVAPDGQITLAQIPALISHAWETLLSTHPHDTLCGCSTDDVAVAMGARQREVAGVLPELRAQSLAMVLAHDRVAARTRPVTDTAVVVRNRVARPRGGVVEVELKQTLADIGVGPGSAGRVPTEITLPSSLPAFGDGEVQVLSSRIVHERRESPQHYPDDDLVLSHRALAWIAPVPALGLRVIGANGSARGERFAPVSITRDAQSVRISNGRLTLHASPGGIALEHGARRIDDILSLETRPDFGDSYTASPRGVPERLVLSAIRVGAKGPLRRSIHCRWDWSRTVERGERHIREHVRLWTELSIDAGASHMRCDVRGWNGRKNHRLQLWWRSDVTSPALLADAAFGPVERTPIAAAANASPAETPPRTMPLHRWLTLHDANGGATLISDGLAESDTRTDNSGVGALGVTLLRATGELSRAHLPERPGHAGWPCAIPMAQCRGKFSARVGILLHGPMNDSTMQDIEHASDDVLLPLVGETWRDVELDSGEFAGPRLEGAGLAASTVRVSDDGRALFLRCVNLTSSPKVGAWRLPTLRPGDRWIARTCRMDGDALSDWTDADSQIPFEAGSRAVVTFEVRRQRPDEDLP